MELGLPISGTGTIYATDNISILDKDWFYGFPKVILPRLKIICIPYSGEIHSIEFPRKRVCL
jgi:hypothetical protein